MPTSLVLTVLGEDRPGLVEALSHIIAAHEGNWLESRMAHLAGQFAGILRASVPEGNAAALLTACKGSQRTDSRWWSRAAAPMNWRRRPVAHARPGRQ